MSWWLICCFIIWGLFAFTVGVIISNYDNKRDDDDGLVVYGGDRDAG